MYLPPPPLLVLPPLTGDGFTTCDTILRDADEDEDDGRPATLNARVVVLMRRAIMIAATKPSLVMLIAEATSTRRLILIEARGLHAEIIRSTSRKPGSCIR